jgi:DNA repair protein SbcC/Rad50
MTVISRLFRKAPSAPEGLDETPSEAPSQPPEAAAGDTAGDALYALAGVTGAQPETAAQHQAQRRLAELIDTGEIPFAEISERSTNPPALLSIAALCKDGDLLPKALAAIDDEEQLGRLAIGGATPAIRQLAAERVQDPATLAQLLKAARGKDKNVYRIVKHKRDAIQAQRRAAAAELAAMQTLCTSIERHIPQPFNSTYVSVVDHLAAQWQTLVASAPAELKGRVEAAIARSRLVIAQHQQQIASQAAHAAAVDEAPAERQAILRALQALLAGLYAATEQDRAGQIAAQSARWTGLLQLKAPRPEEIAAFRQFGEAIESMAAFNAQYGSVAQLAAALSEENVHPLRSALGHVALLAESVPVEACEAAAALQAWEQARAAQRAAAAATLRQVSGLLRKAQSTLAAGHSRQAAGLRRAVEDKLHTLARVPPHLGSQLQAFDAQLGLLQDWRSFAVAPKRGELIAQMEALIDAGEAPTALAERIKRLQDEWKLISKGSTENTQAEWQRFHEAAQKAYEPCREFFAAQAAKRADNLERRGALLARLQAFAAAQNWEQADWREVARAVRESAQQWRSFQPVERGANRPLQETFNALSAELNARLAAEYTRNAEAKRALIERAQRLSGSEDSRQAAEEVKRLQLAWQSVGLVAHEESQRLWEQFRQHCDAVFARRQQQHSEYLVSLDTNKTQAVALCEEAERLLALSGPELGEGAKQLAPLRASFAALGELPAASARGLRGRFENALDRCEQKLSQLRAQERMQGWERVLEAGNCIRRYRLSAAEGAPPETCATRKQEAQEFIDGVTQWPKGALRALQVELAAAGSRDFAANEAALRTLCIRAELLTDTPTPAGDLALRREYQLQQLLKGLGQARAPGSVELEALVFEWLAAGATRDAVYEELLQRFNACRRNQT